MSACEACGGTGKHKGESYVLIDYRPGATAPRQCAACKGTGRITTRELVETRWAVRRGEFWEGADNNAETRALRVLFASQHSAEVVAAHRSRNEDARVVRVRIYRVTR